MSLSATRPLPGTLLRGTETSPRAATVAPSTGVPRRVVAATVRDLEHEVGALLPASGRAEQHEDGAALYAGLTYAYLLLMVFPLYNAIESLDHNQIEAARDLGATPWQAFWRITVPLSRGGIIAGALLVFIPCVGEFVIPELLGGPGTLMIGRRSLRNVTKLLSIT